MFTKKAYRGSRGTAVIMLTSAPLLLLPHAAAVLSPGK